MSPIVNIVNIGSAATESHANVTEIHKGLEFSGDDEGYSFGIFSVKFSNDGKELVAGSSDDSIYVYDIEANKLSLRIQAHTGRIYWRLQQINLSDFLPLSPLLLELFQVHIQELEEEVMAAVGLTNQRLEIPKDVDPLRVSLIESVRN